MFKKILLPSLLFIVALFVIIFLWSRLSRVDSLSERTMRLANLKQWSYRCKEFIGKKDKVPSSLYEIAWFDEQGPPVYEVGIGSVHSNEIVKMKDKQYFADKVEFTFFVDESGWIIMERNPGKYWKRRLMIDNTGQVFEIRNVK